MSAQRNRRRGYLLVTFGAVLFSLNAGISRVIQTAGVASTTLTTVRCTGTALVLLVVVLARGERLTLPHRPREIVRLVGFGITGVALVQWFYFVAIARLPVGIALMLQFTAPVLVALWVRFVYREPVRSRIWVGIACSLGGLALVAQVWSGLALDGIGLLAGLAASGSLATYFLLGEHSVSLGSPLHVITEAFIVAGIFWNVVAPVTRVLDTNLTRPTSLVGNLASVHVPVWVLLVLMVVLGTAIPFLAELSAMQYLSATEVGLVAMLEVVGATIVGWTWFNQTLTPAQSVGGVAILVGIGLAQTARVRRPRTRLS